jgi:hypothetical protein
LTDHNPAAEIGATLLSSIDGHLIDINKNLSDMRMDVTSLKMDMTIVKQEVGNHGAKISQGESEMKEVRDWMHRVELKDARDEGRNDGRSGFQKKQMAIFLGFVSVAGTLGGGAVALASLFLR